MTNKSRNPTPYSFLLHRWLSRGGLLIVLFGPLHLHAFGQTRFEAPVLYPVGSNASSLTVIDANADGLPDLAVTNRSSETVSLLINKGQGTFQSAVDFPVADPKVVATPRAVQAADIDEDGDMDLIVANESEAVIVVLFNDGAARFSTRLATPAERLPSALTIVDLDNDGDLDIAVTHKQTEAEGPVGVLINRGFTAGVWQGFDPMVTYAVWLAGRAIVSADFDEDGDVDLVNCDRDGRRYTLLRNSGSGSFPVVDHTVVGWAPRDIAVADFDGNNSIDFAVADFGDGSMWLVRNKGGVGAGWLGFEMPVSYPGGGDRPHAIAAGDFDNDDDIDLAMANVGDDTISLFWNDGNAHFDAVNTVPSADRSPSGIIAHDLDGDGDIDIATANSISVSVLINQGFCYPDCDLSTGVGTLDLFDFLCFQSSFVSGQTYACDCDLSTGPGVCDLFDFLCFQTAFVTGCP